MSAPPAGPARWLETILAEHASLAAAVAEADSSALGEALLSARRVFVCGAGRSGLALRMAAMRLMHLGLAVHVVGEVTAPAIGAGDRLLAVSGSGATAGVVRAAQTARSVGASVSAVTTDPGSPLAAAADTVLVLRAATKQDRSGAVSAQYAGALFEQAVLLVFDALFETLAAARGETPERLWSRHANLE